MIQYGPNGVYVIPVTNRSRHRILFEISIAQHKTEIAIDVYPAPSAPSSPGPRPSPATSATLCRCELLALIREGCTCGGK